MSLLLSTFLVLPLMLVFLLPEFLMLLLEFRFELFVLLLIFVFELLAGLVTLVPEPLEPGLVVAGLFTAGRD